MISIPPRADRPAYDKTIVTELTGGGLGNQMFQFAFGLAVARTLNAPYEWVRRPRQGSREFGLSMFGIEEQPYYMPQTVYQNAACGHGVEIRQAVYAVMSTGSSHPGIRGHFQNEKCFAPVNVEIRDVIFKLDPIKLFPNQVSLQVRRGDYVGNKTYDVCGLKYFYDALHHMRKHHLGKATFVVVSDDLEWCRHQFRQIPDIHVPESQTTEEGLRLMAGSEAHIISNSTYGWWGAWLAGGTTIVPDRWLNEKWKGHAWDCAPERWIKIPT